MEKRWFEAVSTKMRKDTDNVILPERKTKKSAGYDFSTPLKIRIPAKSKLMVWTNIKAFMQDDEVLLIFIRNSIGIKKGLGLANGTGIIDADYFNNSDNEGNIGISLVNDTNEDVVLEKGERFAQGIFLNYLMSDNGNSHHDRDGGFGSTD